MPPRATLPAGPDPRPTLAAYGAPFLVRPVRELPLEEAVARSLLLLRDDPRVLYCLPVLFALSVDDFEASVLKNRARELDVEAALGMMLDLTAELTGSEQFHDWASGLHPVHGSPQYLDKSTSDRARAFADERTPPVLAHWGFRSSAPMDDLQQFFRKHMGMNNG